MATVFVRARARRDIAANAKYLEEQGGMELALRFLSAVRHTFEALATMPRAGTKCGFDKPSLRMVRRWPVTDFEHWLIFYRAKRDGVEILHVIHGARDIENILAG